MNNNPNQENEINTTSVPEQKGQEHENGEANGETLESESDHDHDQGHDKERVVKVETTKSNLKLMLVMAAGIIISVSILYTLFISSSPDKDQQIKTSGSKITAINNSGIQEKVKEINPEVKKIRDEVNEMKSSSLSTYIPEYTEGNIKSDSVEFIKNVIPKPSELPDRNGNAPSKIEKEKNKKSNRLNDDDYHMAILHETVAMPHNAQNNQSVSVLENDISTVIGAINIDAGGGANSGKNRVFQFENDSTIKPDIVVTGNKSNVVGNVNVATINEQPILFGGDSIVVTIQAALDTDSPDMVRAIVPQSSPKIAGAIVIGRMVKNGEYISVQVNKMFYKENVYELQGLLLDAVSGSGNLTGNVNHKFWQRYALPAITAGLSKAGDLVSQRSSKVTVNGTVTTSQENAANSKQIAGAAISGGISNAAQTLQADNANVQVQIKIPAGTPAILFVTNNVVSNNSFRQPVSTSAISTQQNQTTSTSPTSLTQ